MNWHETEDSIVIETNHADALVIALDRLNIEAHIIAPRFVEITRQCSKLSANPFQQNAT